MGGRMCSMAVAEGLPAAALVLISYPLHPPGKPDNFRVEHFPNLDVPCLFVSGTKDPFGSPDELERHAKTIPGDVTHLWIEGGGHDFNGTTTTSPARSGNGSSPCVDRVLGVELFERLGARSRGTRRARAPRQKRDAIETMAIGPAKLSHRSARRPTKINPAALPHTVMSWRVPAALPRKPVGNSSGR